MTNFFFATSLFPINFPWHEIFWCLYIVNWLISKVHVCGCLHVIYTRPWSNNPLSRWDLPLYTYILHGIKFKFHGRIGFVKNQFWICNSSESEKYTRRRTLVVDGDATDGLIIVLFAASLVFRFQMSAPIELTPFPFRVGLVFNFHHAQIIKVPDDGDPLLSP